MARASRSFGKVNDLIAHSAMADNSRAELIRKALFGAVRSGDAVRLADLLKDKRNLHVVDDLNKSLFDYAVSGQQGDCIIALMDAGFDPYFHPLHAGLRVERPSARDEFYRTRGTFAADVQNAVECAEKRFALHRYISRRMSNEDILEMIGMTDKANLDLLDGYGRTALFRMLDFTEISLIEGLLKAGANPDIPSGGDKKLTPLAVICEALNRAVLNGVMPEAIEGLVNRRNAIMNLLIAHGASVDVTYPNGMTVLEVIMWNDGAAPSEKESYVKKFDNLRQNHIVNRFRDAYRRASQIPIPKRKF